MCGVSSVCTPIRLNGTVLRHSDNFTVCADARTVYETCSHRRKEKEIHKQKKVRILEDGRWRVKKEAMKRENEVKRI
jgi:hypothetical protein